MPVIEIRIRVLNVIPTSTGVLFMRLENSTHNKIVPSVIDLSQVSNSNYVKSTS